MKALVLAFAFKQNYHVLRVTHDAGFSVHVLGKDCAHGLKYSRFCASFQRLDFDPQSQSIDMALEEIKRAVERVSADVILPSDVVSTRLLAALADRLPVPAYPVPELQLFDLMNNKWNFYHFCKKHDIPTPETALFPTVAEVKQAVARQDVKFPFVVKPLDLMGENGVHIVSSESDLSALDTIEYSPMLVQRHIAGEWIGADILADHGRILAHGVQRNLSDRYAFVSNEKFMGTVERIVAASGYHGAANFDAMHETATGDVYLLECNPRFWYSIFAANLAGLNFVKAGFAMKSIDPATPLSVPTVDIARMGAVIRKWPKLAKLNELEMRTSNYLTSDPIGILCGKMPMFNDGFVRGSGSVDGQRAALVALGRNDSQPFPASPPTVAKAA